MPIITLNSEDEYSEPARARALRECLNSKLSTITEQLYGTGNFDTEDGEYTVMTENEADQAWDESLDSYLEECIYPELPDSMVHYFDDEAWKRDARIDGRGHCLNHYDGTEHEGIDPITKEYFVIFRTN